MYAIRSYYGVMDEQVLGAIIGCDEAIALLVAEPLDCTLCQSDLLPDPIDLHLRAGKTASLQDGSR